jgi:hypothetical protein
MSGHLFWNFELVNKILGYFVKRLIIFWHWQPVQMLKAVWKLVGKLVFWNYAKSFIVVNVFNTFYVQFIFQMFDQQFFKRQICNVKSITAGLGQYEAKSDEAFELSRELDAFWETKGWKQVETCCMSFGVAFEDDRFKCLFESTFN